MGISSVIKLVDSEGHVVRDEDFDKVLNGGLSEIASSLPAQHPFRRLMHLLETGETDEASIQRFESLVNEEANELGWVVISPRQLSEFAEYICGDIAQQWNDLFPGRQPGLGNWIKYHLTLKSIEQKYKEQPVAPQSWYRDDYEELLEVLHRATEEDLHVLREQY